MVNFRDVKNSVDAFNSAVELLNKFQSELHAERYDEASAPWFSVIPGRMPWYFEVLPGSWTTGLATQESLQRASGV
jgi:hypothetical protein